MKKFLYFLIVSTILGSLFFPLLSGTKAVPLSPDKYFFDLKDTKPRKDELVIYGKENLQNTSKVYIYVLGMRKVGEENDREFYEVDKNNKSEVANWIKLDFTEANLKAGDIVKLPWTIQKQGNATCGTNLAAIVVSTSPQTPKDQGSVVAIKNEVVSQVHVNVTQADGRECDNSAKLSLLEFDTVDSQSLFWETEVPFFTRIKNEGNVIAVDPKGFIEIEGYGDKVTLPFNPESLDIYPGTVRKFDNAWFDKDYPKDGNFFTKLFYDIKHLRIGKYEARLGVTKNVKPQIVATRSFWIIPWRVILALLVILLIVITLVVMNFRSKREVKKLKNNNKKL